VNREQAHQFETDFLPRIVEQVTRVLDRGVRVAIVSSDDPHRPARLHVSAARHDVGGTTHRYPHDLNVYLTWDDDEIARLLRPGGEARFVRYLDAIGKKLDAWQGVREVDLLSRSQGEAAVLIGGLDFEA
jgi:hypothetical protein